MEVQLDRMVLDAAGGRRWNKWTGEGWQLNLSVKLKSQSVGKCGMSVKEMIIMKKSVTQVWVV